jgi:hypothetical protein
LHLPVFELEEILAVWRKWFPRLSRASVLAAYAQWGGLCRYVLDENGNDGEQKLLERKIAAADLNMVIKAVGDADAHDSVSHRVLHIKVTPDFLSHRLEFASAYVARKCVEVFARRQRQSVREFIAAR